MDLGGVHVQLSRDELRTAHYACSHSAGVYARDSQVAQAEFERTGAEGWQRLANQFADNERAAQALADKLEEIL
jgi:hypothetical protein